MSNIINDGALISELQVTHNLNEGSAQTVTGVQLPAGQVITSPAGISRVANITLYMKNDLGATGGIKMDLHSQSAGLPSGALVGTSEVVDISTIPSVGANPVVFTFIDVPVSSESQYAFSIVDDSLTGSFSIYEELTEYAGGNAYVGGVALAVDFMFDSTFEIGPSQIGEGFTAGIYEDIILTSSLSLSVEGVDTVCTLGDVDAAIKVEEGGRLRIGTSGAYMTVPANGAYTIRFKQPGNSIKFMSNGGDGTDDYTVVFPRVANQAISTAAVMGFSHTTLTFTNWNSEPAGTGYTVLDGDSAVMWLYPNATNITLYAQWS